MFIFISNKHGFAGSLLISAVGTLILLLAVGLISLLFSF